MTRPNHHKPTVALDPYSIPPHDLPAEAATLGSLILAGPGETFHEILGAVGSADFYRPGHTAIFDAIGDLYAHAEPVDMVTLQGRLADSGVLKDIGGVEALLNIAEGVPNTLRGPHYARRVRGLARIRRLIDAAHRIGHDAQGNAGDVQGVMDRAQEMILATTGERDHRGAAPVGDGMNDLLGRLERGEAASPGLSTGFPCLDGLLAGGFRAGQLIVLGARPSIGKTALALNIAEYVALNGARPVLIFSLEMKTAQLQVRMLASRAGISGGRLQRGGALDSSALQQLQDAGQLIKAAPLYIDDGSGLTVQQVRSRARRELARRKVELIVVDYLQLVSDPAQENRTQEVSAISAGFKAMASELEVPVLVLSQLNRLSELRDDHRPRLSDLRDSGAIEQDADVVLLLHREDYHRAPGEKHDGLAEIHVAKNRTGRTGVVDVRFDPELTRFAGLTEETS